MNVLCITDLSGTAPEHVGTLGGRADDIGKPPSRQPAEGGSAPTGAFDSLLVAFLGELGLPAPGDSVQTQHKPDSGSPGSEDVAVGVGRFERLPDKLESGDTTTLAFPTPNSTEAQTDRATLATKEQDRQVRFVVTDTAGFAPAKTGNQHWQSPLPTCAEPIPNVQARNEGALRLDSERIANRSGAEVRKLAPAEIDETFSEHAGAELSEITKNGHLTLRAPERAHGGTASVDRGGGPTVTASAFELSAAASEGKPPAAESIGPAPALEGVRGKVTLELNAVAPSSGVSAGSVSDASTASAFDAARDALGGRPDADTGRGGFRTAETARDSTQVAQPVVSGWVASGGLDQPFDSYVHQALRTLAPGEADVVKHLNLEIVRSARMQLLEGRAGLDIRVDPPHLGAVRVQMHLEQGSLTAAIQTTTETARQILQSGLDDLRTALTNHGINVESLSVSVDSQAGQGWHASSDAGARSGRGPTAAYSRLSPGSALDAQPRDVVDTFRADRYRVIDYFA